MWKQALTTGVWLSLLVASVITSNARGAEPGVVKLETLAFQDTADAPAPAPPKPEPKPAAQPATPKASTPDSTQPEAKPDAAPTAAPKAATPPAEVKPDSNAQPAPVTRPQPSPFSGLRMPSGRRSFLSRVARAPDMFGDFNTLSVAEVNPSMSFSNPNPVVTVPAGGAVRRYKNEQARALPTDRAFVFFNHFHNAVELNDFTGSDSANINQFTLGVERTLGDGDWSIEFRLPIATETDLATTDTSAHSDGLGNLAVTLKKLLYDDDALAVALGLAVTAPTGDNADVSFFGADLTIENEAVHMLPYLAMQFTPDDNWFFHVFGQVDVAANGDGVRVDDGFQVFTGRIVEQTLMFLDVSAGYWWLRTDVPDATGLTGLASVVELHYSTALNDAHSPEFGFITVGNRDNRFDVVNLTLGLHSEWHGDTALRLAAVVPLRSRGENRFFDAEFQVALIKRLR